MALRDKVSSLAVVIGSIAFALNLYIYTYPSLNPQACSWKDAPPTRIDIPWLGDLIETHILDKFAPRPDPLESIRLLAIGDPQINGNWPKTPYIKRFDNYGNDYYLGHIYDVMKKRLHPTHVAVLGDLFLSQWISDSEFYNRTRRYLTRLYPQPENHTKEIFEVLDRHENLDWNAYLNHIKSISPNEAFDYHFENTYDWIDPSVSTYQDEPLFINLTGNHDVGYSGDATWQHMTRWARLFGKDNFYIEYHRGTPRAYRLVVLNLLFLEGPALQPEFLEYTYHFLEKLEARKFEGQTILLTHIPFYKKEGLCVDGPKHIYYTEETLKREPYKLGNLRAQNHLSYDVSQRVLDAVFGNSDKPGIILTGHDHEGCYNVYDKNPETGEWVAAPDKKHHGSAQTNYVQEVTVRAVMGEYGGNMGLMTGTFNKYAEEWEYHYSACPFIVQHVWWATKVILVVELFLISFLIAT